MAALMSPLILNGMVTTPVGNGACVAYSIALQNDGKILVAGVSNSGSFNEDLTLIRYNTDGSLDLTFDADGIVTYTGGKL
jgi:hypothetical protein